MRVRPVQYVPPNRLGRDFVVGDVHGCFRTLDWALAALEFDASRDRLFGVGDFVERGPHSHEALDWIDHRFTAVTLGNHEDAALGWLEDRLQGSREAPYGWLRSIAPNAYPRWRDALREMPFAVTVETPHGAVAIVMVGSPRAPKNLLGQGRCVGDSHRRFPGRSSTTCSRCRGSDPAELAPALERVSHPGLRGVPAENSERAIFDEWLAPDTPVERRLALAPSAYEGPLDRWSVSRRVNTPGTTSRTCCSRWTTIRQPRRVAKARKIRGQTDRKGGADSDGRRRRVKREIPRTTKQCGE